MHRTNIYLAEEQTKNLDKLAEQQGVSRAELIRTLLDRALTGNDDDLAADLAAIEDSFGIFGDIDAPVRGPDGREEHLSKVWRGVP